MEQFRQTIEQHRRFNDHHPEYHENGVEDMDMIQLFEMLADWKAASERNKNGSLKQSIEINAKRYGMSNQIYHLIIKTAENLKWLDS